MTRLKFLTGPTFVPSVLFVLFAANLFSPAPALAGDPTVRNQAEFSAFTVVPPKLQILSAVSDKAEYDPNKKVTLEIKIKNPEAVDFDITVDVTVTDPAKKEVFKKTGIAATITANGEVKVTPDFTLSKTAAAGGYALNAVVTFNKEVVATKDAAGDFKVKRPPPLTISPATVTVGRGKTQAFTAAGAQGTAVFSMQKIMPPNVWDFSDYGSLSGKVYTAGKYGGKQVKIIVKDDLDRTAEAIATVSSEVEITAPGGTEVEPGRKLPLGYEGGSSGKTATFWIKSNKSGGKIDDQTYVWYLMPGSVTSSVVDQVCVKVDGDPKESCLNVTVSPASIDPQSLDVGPGQNFFFKIVGGVSGVSTTFKVNTGAENCGTINSGGNFTSGALDISKADADAGVVELKNKFTYAIVADRTTTNYWKSMTINKYLYADVAITSTPLPLTIYPTEATLTEFEEQVFKFSGGKGTTRTFSVESGQSYPAIKAAKNGGIYMAGYMLGKDRVCVATDQNEKACADITVKMPDPEDEGTDWKEVGMFVGGVVADAVGLGDLFELASTGLDIYEAIKEGNERKNYVEKKYSEFKGSIFQGAYKKGATVTATNLNDPSQTATSEVLDDNGRYYIKVPWDGPTKIEASGPFMDEFTGKTTKIRDELSAVANGVDSKLVTCDVNIPTSIAAEIIDRKLEKMKGYRKMIAGGQIDMTNEKVGQTICGKPGVDVSEVDFGNLSDPNSSKVTKFHVAVAALAGPNKVVDAAKQFAGEISTNKPAGSSGAVVSAADLKKTLDKIESGVPFDAKTEGGVISVRPKDVLNRLKPDTRPEPRSRPEIVAPPTHTPAPAAPTTAVQDDRIDAAKRILARMVAAFNQKNVGDLVSPLAPNVRVSLNGKATDAGGFRSSISSALPYLSDLAWDAQVSQGTIDPKTGAARLRVTSTYSAKLSEPVGVISASLAKPAEVISAQKRVTDAFNTSAEEIYEFGADASGRPQVTEIVSALPLDAALLNRVTAVGAAWDVKVSVFGLFYYIEQNDLAKFGDLIGSDFINNDDNGFKHNKSDFVESVKADLDHLTSIDHTVRVEDIQFDVDRTSGRVLVSWDRRARIANQKTEWTIKAQRTTFTFGASPAGYKLALIEGSPLFGNSSRYTRKTKIASGELDGTTVEALVVINDARETSVALPASDLPEDPISKGCGGSSKTFTYTGAAQTFTVPTFCPLTIKAWGAGGGGGGFDADVGGHGGGGAYSTTSVTLKQGYILQIYVAGGGDSGATAIANSGGGTGGWGYGSGGRGGHAGAVGGSGSGGGGGGSTAVTNQSGAAFYVVAAGGGGGGGAGNIVPNRAGGAGGGGGENGTATSVAGGVTGASGSKNGATGGDGGAGNDGGGGGGGGAGYTGGGTGGNAAAGPVPATDDKGGSGGAGGNSTGTVTLGSGKTPGNSTDADLPAGLATGGDRSTGLTVATRATPGGAGYVKISW